MNKKEKSSLVLIGIILVIISLVTLYIRFVDPQNSNIQSLIPGTKKENIDIKGLKPNNIKTGESGLSDVISAMGEPMLDKNGFYEFKSNSEVFPHQAVFKNDTLIFFKEVITYQAERTFSDLESLYGKPEYVLYGENSVGGDYLFISPSKGVAYIGNPETNSVIEVWYFETMSIDEFRQKWAKRYVDSLDEVEKSFSPF